MSRLEDIRYCVETEEENYTMPFARQRAMAHRRYLLGLVDRLKVFAESARDNLDPDAAELLAEMEGTDGKQQD